MTIPKLGKLENVAVRTVWKREDRNFTPWLAENITQLGEVLNMDLEVVRQEAQTGDFYLDILARDRSSGAMVAIENQLEWTDHSHLGQILTYAGGHDARILIWVTPQFRDEHRAALDWLNRWTPDEIEVYGVEVRAVKIGASAIAPEFIPVAFPNAWSKRGSRYHGGTNQLNLQRQEFFQPLIDDLHAKRYTDRSRAYAREYQPIPSGIHGATFRASIEGDKAWVYIGGDSIYAAPSHITDGLRDGDRAGMEEKLGIEDDSYTEIDWDTGQTHNIGVYRKGSLDDEEKHDEIRQWMSHYLRKFKKVFNPRMEKIISELENSDK